MSTEIRCFGIKSGEARITASNMKAAQEVLVGFIKADPAGTFSACSPGLSIDPGTAILSGYMAAVSGAFSGTCMMEGLSRRFLTKAIKASKIIPQLKKSIKPAALVIYS